MRHHFADFLDRERGHWAIVPNAERMQYHLPDLQLAPDTATILTVTGQDTNWPHLAKLARLEELTLNEPTAEQIAFLSTLWRLKRLRISFARPADLEPLRRLAGLEELVLEYVSGVDDLSPLGGLSNLRALHLENLRRVADFSPLAGLGALKSLSIHGTFDWRQPINDFAFLARIPALEALALWQIQPHDSPPGIARHLAGLPLARIDIERKEFPLETYAEIDAALPGVDGARFEPIYRAGLVNHRITADDPSFALSDTDFLAQHPGGRIFTGGRREVPDPAYEYWFPIGKGDRRFKVQARNAAARAEAYAKRYHALVEAARTRQGQ